MLEQPMSDDWKLVAPDEPYEKADNTYRFKTVVDANETEAYPVRFEFVHSTHYGLSDMDLGQIRIYQRNAEISRSVRDALAKVIELRSDLDETRRQIQRKELAIREIDSEQRRIRENMKALPRDSDVFSRYVRKLNDQEDQIESLRSELEQLRRQADRQQKALEDYLLSLNVE
jgi:predicted  nucleic acid-binding Zn-ribbon protein